MAKKNYLFLDSFPNHKYRYIDQTGLGRPPVSSAIQRPDLNLQGYEAYFTPNGFEGENAKIENCISLNAFFVDIDGRKDHAELDEIKKILEPSFILETKNGFHLYWLLDEVIKREDLSEEEWKKDITRWERIEESIVKHLNADPAVKDVPRILRIPDTFYWKKSGEAFRDGTKDVFKIKGLHKNIAANYSMNQVEEAFPLIQDIVSYDSKTSPEVSHFKKYAEDERKDFFIRVNKVYPLEDRPSFLSLISGKEGTVAPNTRNQSLIVAASLMKQAGWKKEKALEHITEVGWHGMEKDRGGLQEIQNTINSAYGNNYTYSYKNEIIAKNMTPDEQRNIQDAYTAVSKQKRESDKIRFTNYEQEVLNRMPYLKKNEIGLVFNYKDGVYKIVSDLEIQDLILNNLYDDMLWGYRTKRNVADKVACLLSIIPPLVLTNDGNWILNVKNGLLNLKTMELVPHTPNFVSLTQLPVAYDPEAKCPIWEECMDAWMEGPEKEEKTQLLKQFCGYTLTSSMNYDKALFLVGDGGNGKSTCVDTIARVIGPDSTAHIDLEGLYGQYGMKGLIGKRLNIIEEVQGNFYQSNKLKKLISGEEVTIDMKYKDQFTFRPQAKFIFAVNIMPRVDDTSTATERRIVAINFRNNFRDNPNTSLRSNFGLLAQELAGILNWMIEGAHDLAKAGRFIVTKEQINMLSEYRQENSSVEGFIAECAEVGESYEVSGRDLYEEYRAFCQRDGRKFKGNISFVKEMKAYGARYGLFRFEERTSGHTAARFVGIRIINDWSSSRATETKFQGF